MDTTKELLRIVYGLTWHTLPNQLQQAIKEDLMREEEPVCYIYETRSTIRVSKTVPYWYPVEGWESGTGWRPVYYRD